VPRRSRQTPPALHDAALDLLVDVLRDGREQTITARGSSMAPAIPHGARLTLAPFARGADPRLGDVVAVRTPTLGLLVHRVVGVRCERRRARSTLAAVLLRGDACAEPDGWFSPQDVLARVLLDGVSPPAAGAMPRARRPLVARLWARLRRAADQLLR
jgi:hypothetical protein